MAGEFKTFVTVTYEVGVDGVTTVTHDVTLENVFSTLYAKNYALNLEGIDVFSPRAFYLGRGLPVNFQKIGDSARLELTFDDVVVGKGEQRSFRIEYQDREFATRTGEVWEVFAPKVVDPMAFDSYQAILSVPFSLGEPAYLSPAPISQKKERERNIFVFSKEQLADNGITAAFGEFQVFSFDLTYHLENPLGKRGVVEIAIPPDTSYQRVFYKEVSPKPQNVALDEDGNWLATYVLGPRERVDVKAKGYVQIFSQPLFKRGVEEEAQLEKYLQETEVWQVGNIKIQELARKLGTPRAIYDYLVQSFKYDYARVRPNVDRLGALGALENPQMAICMEFTDAFVALARAAGIPAREVNGYAYTENPEIQPLSLVADVLHAWPEYWDSKLGVWKPVDPTWGNTTGGIDYFEKLDLRHFPFVMHGVDPYKPYPPGSYKLGANPQKDVFVAFSQLPEERSPKPVVKITPVPLLPFSDIPYRVTIENTGESAIYSEEVKIFVDNALTKTSPFESLLPYETIEIPFEAKVNLTRLSVPESLRVVVGGHSVTAPVNKLAFVAVNAGTLFFTLFGIGLLSFLAVKRLRAKR